MFKIRKNLYKIFGNAYLSLETKIVGMFISMSKLLTKLSHTFVYELEICAICQVTQICSKHVSLTFLHLSAKLFVKVIDANVTQLS